MAVALSKVVTYKVVADTKAATKSLVALDKQLDRVDASADEARASIKSVGSVSQKAGGNIRYSGSEAGKLAGALRLVSPEAAIVADSLGKVSEGAELVGDTMGVSLTSLVGMTAALGAAVGVYALYSKAVGVSADALKRQREEQERVHALLAGTDAALAMVDAQLKLKFATDQQRVAAQAAADAETTFGAAIAEGRKKVAFAQADITRGVDGAQEAYLQANIELAKLIQNETIYTAKLIQLNTPLTAHAEAQTAVKVTIEETNEALEAQTELLEGIATSTDATAGINESVAAARFDQTQKQKAADQSAFDAKKMQTKADTDSSLGSLSQIGGATSDLFALMGKENSKFFAAEKAAAIAQVAFSTAQAVAKVWGQSGLAGALLQAAPIAMGAVQIANIASQKAPSYHIGGSNIDGRGNISATLQSGESVLTRAATARLGAKNIDNINSGQGMNSGKIVMVNQYKHQVFDSFVQDNLRRRGPLRKAISKNSTYGQK